MRRSLDTGSKYPGEEVRGGPCLVWRSHRTLTLHFPGLEQSPRVAHTGPWALGAGSGEEPKGLCE